MFRLVDALEDLDDVQNVFANYDVPDEVMEQLDGRLTLVEARRPSRPEPRTEVAVVEAVAGVLAPHRVCPCAIPASAPAVSVVSEQVFGREG